MKKIMFNDKYGLTDAVLEGRKTQTRRVINVSNSAQIFCPTPNMHNTHTHKLQQAIKLAGDWLYVTPNYQVGEVVAVAQSYSIVADYMLRHNLPFFFDSECAGWNNKMFVKSELMPHHIRITNIRVERLQDISDDDCIKEGITPIYEAGTDPKVVMWYALNNVDRESRYETPREAYAALIDKVGKKGTWESNPWVFVYDFELID